MRHFIFISPLFFFVVFIYEKPLAQGIDTNKDFTAEQLVKDIFLKSGCQNVSNIQAINNGSALGYFEGGSPIFGFDSGIIVSSGDVEMAEGPNEESGSSFAYGVVSNDLDMQIITSGIVFDVGGIEFDFVPVGETVTFEYAFASEEYCKFVGSVFNDVFGFFVSGPGINGPFSDGAINVALVPGSTDFVAINSINHQSNPDLYIKNELAFEADECGVPFDPAFPDLIEYDGMTVQLTASFDVIPCETYHIRLLVADVGDDILDSGVFLKEKSFDLSGDVSVRAEAENSSEPVAVEGCRAGSFVFSRAGSLANDLTVDFTISPTSTAESGVDYAPLPTSVTIPAGEPSVTLPVDIFDDGMVEGTESIVLEISFPCNCLDPILAELFIEDLEMLSATSSEINVCTGQPFTAGVEVMGGMEPFIYSWSDGSGDSILSASITDATIFTVTVTDECGTTSTANIAATTQAVPTAVLSGDERFCESLPSFLEVSFEGSPPYDISYSIDGQIQPDVTDVFENPYLLPLTSAGIYSLDIFNDAYCMGNVQGEVEVLSSIGEVTFSVTPSTCFKNADGAIDWSVEGGAPSLDAEWNPPVNNVLNPTGLFAGIYTLSLTGLSGCQVEYIVEVPVQSNKDCEPFSMYIPNAFSPNADGFNDEFRFYPADDSHIIRVKSLHIFNRWGDLVFEKKNFPPSASEALWDGTFNGKKMNTGVFVWQAILELNDGTEEVAAGELMLMR